VTACCLILHIHKNKLKAALHSFLLVAALFNRRSWRHAKFDD